MFFNYEINKNIFEDSVLNCGWIFSNNYTMFSFEYPNEIQWYFTNWLKRIALKCIKGKLNYYNYPGIIQLYAILIVIIQ